MYFLLVIIGATLIVLNIKAIKKEEGSFNRAMTEAESEVSEVDMKIIKMRSEFSKTITELQREISNLKDDYHGEENVILKENYEENVNLIENYSDIDGKHNFIEDNSEKDKENLNIYDKPINIVPEAKYNNVKVKLSEKKDIVHNKENFHKNLEESNNEYINSLIDTINSFEDEICIENKKNIDLNESKIENNEIDKSVDKAIVGKVKVIKTKENKVKIDEVKVSENKDNNSETNIKSNSLKVEDVKKLLLQGLSDEQIAQSLNIGKGEVLLIKELYLK